MLSLEIMYWQDPLEYRIKGLEASKLIWLYTSPVNQSQNFCNHFFVLGIGLYIHFFGKDPLEFRFAASLQFQTRQVYSCWLLKKILHTVGIYFLGLFGFFERTFFAVEFCSVIFLQKQFVTLGFVIILQIVPKSV